MHKKLLRGIWYGFLYTAGITLIAFIIAFMTLWISALAGPFGFAIFWFIALWFMGFAIVIGSGFAGKED